MKLDATWVFSSSEADDSTFLEFPETSSGGAGMGVFVGVYCVCVCARVCPLCACVCVHWCC